MEHLSKYVDRIRCPCVEFKHWAQVNAVNMVNGPLMDRKKKYVDYYYIGCLFYYYSFAKLGAEITNSSFPMFFLE